MSGGGDMRVEGSRGKPATDAPVVEWYLYFESRLESLRRQVDSQERDLKREVVYFELRLADEAQTRLRGDTSLAEWQIELLVGKDGISLKRTFRGLALTGIGTILQLLAALGSIG